MNKPVGYDETQAYGEYETLPAGGYKCLIKKVACEKTKEGKEYLKIAFDIAEGEYKDFYQRKFDNDTRAEKKWSGIWAVFIKGYEPETTNPKFVGLITSVETSNNFLFDWGRDGNEQDLVGKKIGIVFREEDFLGQDGKIHTAVKPLRATAYDKAEEAKIPKKKTLSETTEINTNNNIYRDDLPF